MTEQISVNQTTIPIDKGYPQRFQLPDHITSWELSLPFYRPNVAPDYPTAFERLEAAGIVLAHPTQLDQMAGLSNRQLEESYGPQAVALRHPLGRTGINGAGRYWVAGASRTADFAATRENVDGPEIALVFNRGGWRLPGGFEADVDRGDAKAISLREGCEELQIASLEPLAEAGQMNLLINDEVKPRSKGSTDMGFLRNSLGHIHLPETEMGDDIEPGDDAERAGWFTFSDTEGLKDSGFISADHWRYINLAFANLATSQS